MIRSTSNISNLYTVWSSLDSGKGNWKKGKPRQFSSQLSNDELNNIKYILERLSSKSLIGLLKEKRELKKRGQRLDHVHPLTFFIGVLSPQCVSAFYSLKHRKGLPLDEFVKGAVESFHDERKHGNISDSQLQTFAKITGRCIHQIRAFVNSNDWKGLIRWL
ncbi:MAG: hypothetical protein S4CHLAM6_15300 [Chlamydiae bacterium]|nr:hypothetical protein [Chlamydiota bacterium]